MNANDWVAISAIAATAAIVVNIVIRAKDIGREHKRRLLDDIRAWAESTISLIDEFKRGSIGTEPYHRQLALRARKTGFTGVVHILGKELEQKLLHATEEFDAFCEQHNHTDAEFKRKAGDCTKSMFSLLDTISKYRTDLKL